MDLMYLPETITYPLLHASSNVYPYEPDAPLWIKADQPQKPLNQQKQQVSDVQTEKRGSHGSSCSLCKERQRRRLASYIRTKSRQDSECTIEEEEEEEEEYQAQQQRNCRPIRASN